MRFENVLVTGAGGLLGRYVVDELKGRCRVAGLDVAGDPADIAFARGSIEDTAAVAAAAKGQDAILHIAARPNIWSGSGSQIMATNVVGTWNVLEAAEQAGVRRVILTSSDSVVGFTVLQGRMIAPDYLPIDLDHPLRPTDPYALSKQMGEVMGRSFAARGLEVVVIRPVYVLYPEFECEVRARAADPKGYKGPSAGGRQPAGGGVMWHYVDPRDLARAYRLALEADRPDFGPYFISAASTLAPEPTVERLAVHMGVRIPVRQPHVYTVNPHAPLYDVAPACDGLGYEAQHDMRTLLYPAGA